MRDYTKIKAWTPADDLTVAIYERAHSFPREEMYGLASQLRRPTYSVLANIVEGSARESKWDYRHFLYIARVSLSETQYFLHLAKRLQYLNKAEAEDLIEQTRATFGSLHCLIQAVEKQAGKLSRTMAAITSMAAL